MQANRYDFSKRERQGIIVLIMLITASVAFSGLWQRTAPVKPVPADSALTAKVKVVQQVIVLKKQYHQDTFYHKARYKPRIIIPDINTADSAAWESLPGIGPVLAARIVRFRERLGGFYAIAQVGETYGLPDSTFKKIQPSLRLGTVSLKKLDLNGMDEKSLAQHPYIHYKLARLIVLYRSNNGPFRQPEALLGIPLVDDSIYRKLEPYIKTEN